MPISSKTQKCIDHYRAIRDLIGEEDVAFLKAFLDAAHTIFDDEEGDDQAPENVRQGMGVLCDILDPEGIAA